MVSRTQEKKFTDFLYPSTGGIGAQNSNRFLDSAERGANKNTVHLFGIASDEPKRIKKHINKPNVILPLVEADWQEDMCGLWCKLNDLLSPIYTTSARGGCWFCHNQSVNQLRQLRKNYSEYWKLLLKWDADSPVTFKPDGHTVHDFDERFRLEDEMLIDPDATFRWKMLNEDLQYRMF